MVKSAERDKMIPFRVRRPSKASLRIINHAIPPADKKEKREWHWEEISSPCARYCTPGRFIRPL